MNDLLTAESILFAVIIALFGFWYPQINELIDLSIPGHPADRKPYFDKAKNILKVKMRPLLMVLTISSLIFIPDTIKITCATIKILFTNGFMNYFSSYDAISTAYFFFCIFLIIMTIYSYHLSFKLKKKKNELYVKP